MAKNTQELAEKISSQSPMINPDKNLTLVDEIKKYYAEKGKEVDATIAQLVVMEVTKNPDLLQCSRASIIRSAESARLEGLNFGTGDAYLVPFNNKKKVGGKEVWVKECQYIRGYRGLLKLIRRSQEVSNIGAYPVYEKDDFDLSLGTDPKVKHIPSLDEDRGKLRGFYCVAQVQNQGTYIEWMSIKEINAIKDRSKAGKFGPWVSDFAEMGRKTILKRAGKYLPIAIETAASIQADEEIEFGEPQTFEMNLGELPEATEEAEAI